MPDGEVGMDKMSQSRKGRVPSDRNSARRGITLVVVALTAIMVLAISFSPVFTPAGSGAVLLPLCVATAPPPITV